jgi:plastocyanin
MSFSPASATLRVGQTVAWRNTDTDVHTATQDWRAIQHRHGDARLDERAYRHDRGRCFPVPLLRSIRAWLAA